MLTFYYMIFLLKASVFQYAEAVEGAVLGPEGLLSPGGEDASVKPSCDPPQQGTIIIPATHRTQNRVAES